MTTLTFASGAVIELTMPIDDVTRLLQEALAKRVMLEIQASDGRRIFIHPQQVQFLEDATARDAG